jgi:hypothetical protein
MHDHPGITIIFLAVAGIAMAIALPPVALAQSPGDKRECESAPPAKSPTATAKGPDSGTKNMGSTGWSGGGMGGSHNDTTQAGPLPGAGTDQPATAQGLDPTKPNPAKRSPC